MKKLTKIFAILCAIICLSLTFTACSKEEYTYWQTDRKAAGSTLLEYTAEISFGSSNIKVTEIWINLSNVDFNPSSKETTISVKLLKSSSTATPTVLPCKVSADDLKNSKDGWVQIYFSETAVEAKTVTISVVDKMRVNEVCFVKENGMLATLTFSKAGVMAGSLGKLYTQSELEALADSEYAYDKNGNYAFNLIDEQEKFPLEYIQTQPKN